MKIYQKRLPALVVAFAAIAITVAGARDVPPASQASRDTEASNSLTSTEPLASNALSNTKSELGTKDAPVDGKDGKPHAGPWVESSSDREDQTIPGDGAGPPTPGRKPSPRPIAAPPIPEVNDGVMDDPNRKGPKKGTTGTEGGVSEKDRDRKAQEGQTGEKPEKTPDSPKEAPPLPHSEVQKIKEQDGVIALEESAEEKISSIKEGEKEESPKLGGLAKPTDLPPAPYEIPHPAPPSGKKDPLHDITPDSGTQTPFPVLSGEPSGLIQPLHSLLLSLTMILFSEVGDKTFLVAALMAMKHPRLLVFSAAFSALIAMTILSALLGHALPTLIPKRFTNLMAAALFLIFGAKLLREGYQMRPDENVSEEMKEVEMELEEKEHLARRKHRRSSVTPYNLEAGRADVRASRSNSRLPSPPRSPSSSRSRSPSPSSASRIKDALGGLDNLFSFLLTPAWVQTFIMTFLGEWGDRSQIATIAMAAGQDYWWVTGGALIGHAICTAAAVIGGRAIAGKVSLRVVTLGGAISFLAFGIIYLAEGLYYA